MQLMAPIDFVNNQNTMCGVIRGLRIKDNT